MGSEREGENRECERGYRVRAKRGGVGSTHTSTITHTDMFTCENGTPMISLATLRESKRDETSKRASKEREREWETRRKRAGEMIPHMLGCPPLSDNTLIHTTF